MLEQAINFLNKLKDKMKDGLAILGECCFYSSDLDNNLVEQHAMEIPVGAASRASRNPSSIIWSESNSADISSSNPPAMLAGVVANNYWVPEQQYSLVARSAEPSARLAFANSRSNILQSRTEASQAEAFDRLERKTFSEQSAAEPSEFVAREGQLRSYSFHVSNSVSERSGLNDVSANPILSGNNMNLDPRALQSPEVESFEKTIVSVMAKNLDGVDIDASLANDPSLRAAMVVHRQQTQLFQQSLTHLRNSAIVISNSESEPVSEGKLVLPGQTS